MKKFYFNHVIALVTFFISSCVFAQYDGGIIVANEGNYGSPNASVDFLKLPGLEKTENIYQTVNNEPLGDVLQSIAFYENSAYLVVNNSNRVVKVNRTTFEKEAEITKDKGIDQPRYMTFAKGKAFVTNAKGKTVTVYDVNNGLALLKTISASSTPENIVATEDKVYVQLSYFSSGKRILVLNAETLEEITTIEVEQALSSIVLDDTKEHLYALCQPSGNNRLYQISTATNTIEKEWPLEDLVKSRKLTYNDGLLYFASRENIYSFNPANEDLSLLFQVTDNSWSTLYGFDIIDNKFYTADASGFTNPSQVSVYDESGNLTTQFKAGMGTNGFYKNEKQPLSTQEVVLAENIVVYPNPTQGVFNLKGVEKAKITIYSLAGQVMKTVDYTGQEIHVSDLAKGTYIVVIETSNGVTKTKLMVQ